MIGSWVLTPPGFARSVRMTSEFAIRSEMCACRSLDGGGLSEARF